jgi:hypothetical protein
MPRDTVAVKSRRSGGLVKTSVNGYQRFELTHF